MNELLVVTPNGYKTSKLYSVVPANGTGDLTWVRNTTATRVNSSGLIESVGANVPRLDYSGGVTCPCILVEPQRTNLFLRSEEFNNAYWSKTNITVTTDNTTAPDGLTTAELLTPTSADSYMRKTSLGALTNVVHTFSIYLKSATGSNISTSIRLLDAVGGTQQINTITVTTSWQRFSVSFLIPIGANMQAWLGGTSSLSTGENLYIWGAQLEAGSSATSYISTVASIQTRNADVATVTTPAGITSLIETYEDNTTNVVNPIPVTYQMSEGRIAKVVGL